MSVWHIFSRKGSVSTIGCGTNEYGDGPAEIIGTVDASPEATALMLAAPDLLEALVAAETAQRLDDAVVELIERSAGEGWDNDPTGSCHIASAGNRAAEAAKRAVQLRVVAIAKAAPTTPQGRAA